MNDSLMTYSRNEPCDFQCFWDASPQPASTAGLPGPTNPNALQVEGTDQSSLPGGSDSYATVFRVGQQTNVPSALGYLGCQGFDS